MNYDHEDWTSKWDGDEEGDKTADVLTQECPPADNAMIADLLGGLEAASWSVGSSISGAIND